MSDDLIQRLRNASAAAVFLDVPDEDSPNHPKQLFAQAADTIVRLTRERGEAQVAFGLRDAANARADVLGERCAAAEAREAKLREAVAEIAKEQSAMSAVAAADRFQQIARAALEKAND